MFNKQDQEAMTKAAKNHRKPEYNTTNDDMSAYDDIKPTHSNEPMTEGDIKFKYDTDEQIDTAIMPPRPEMPTSSQDETLFPGGPSSTEFMAWQKQYPDMYVVDDLPDENIYIYRPISRYEYKVLQALPNTDPLQREELIIDKCLLYPVITYEDMSNAMAGIISVLAQHILTSSGFVKNSIPRKL